MKHSEHGIRAEAAPARRPEARWQRMPFSQILALTTTNLAQGVMLTMPFTVAVYMVRAFLGGVGDEAQIGRMTGLLAAVYSFAQFTTSYAWGLFSSRFGRKPVMVVGSAASSFTLLWFGLSGRFSTAVAARVVAGLLNGIIVAWKCSIGESCGALEQGRVLSYMSLSWGIGCILGPSIGGVASTPCTTWEALPGCQPGGLLRIRPYFLPCAISAAVNAAALVLDLVVLQETLPHLVAAQQQQPSKQQDTSTGTGPGACDVLGMSTAPPSHAGWRQQWAAAVSQAISSRVGRLSLRLGRQVGPRYLQLQQLPEPQPPCGSSCPGCAVCWEMWRAESGLMDTRLQPQLSGKGLWQQDSAASCEMVAVKLPAGAGEHVGLHAGGVPPAPAAEHSTPRGRGLCTIDSASEFTMQRLRGQASKLKGADCMMQHAAAPCKGQAEPQAGACLLSSDCTAHVVDVAPPLQQQQHVLVSQHPACCSPCDTATGTDQQRLEGSQAPHQPSQAPQQHLQFPGQHASHGSEARSDQQQQQGPSAVSSPLIQQQQQPPVIGIATPCTVNPALSPWYKQRQVLLVLMAYGTVCLLFCAIDELTPIFASAPQQQGGLQLSEVQLAGPLAFSGACLIVISLLAFPAAQKTWGTLAVTRQGLCAAVLVAIAIPSTSFAAQHRAQGGGPAGSVSSPAADIGWLAWALMYAAMLLKALAGCFAFTGTMIVVNTSVADPQQLGAVNGVGQSLASLARGVGPAVGGLLWGMTVHLHAHMSGAQLLPFAFVAGTAVVALLLYAFVKPTDYEEVQVAAKGTSCCQE